MEFIDMLVRVRDKLKFGGIRKIKFRSKSWEEGFYYIANKGMMLDYYDANGKIGTTLGFSDDDLDKNDWEFVE